MMKRSELTFKVEINNKRYKESMFYTKNVSYYLRPLYIFFNFVFVCSVE